MRLIVALFAFGVGFALAGRPRNHASALSAFEGSLLLAGRNSIVQRDHVPDLRFPSAVVLGDFFIGRVLALRTFQLAIRARDGFPVYRGEPFEAI